jgi:hypothetical protein
MMNLKRKAILNRIERIQEAIRKAREYLESGQHANWSGFRPWFYGNVRDGKELPPHKDWVKNVFLPGKETALSRAEKLLDRLPSEDKQKVRSFARRQERHRAE